MMPEKRRQEILKLNQEKNGISIKELAEYFNVSSMTILRDIRILEKRKQLEVVRGGVVPLNNLKTEVDSFKNIYELKKRKSFTEKNEIALYCARNMVKEGQVIALEGGSTVSAMIKYLNDKPKITVITNGLFALEESYKRLSTNSRVISTGGILERPYLLFFGPDAENFFNNKHTDIAFFSCVAFDMKVGPMDSNPEEVRLKRAMINSAERRVLLVDKNKFNAKSVMQTVELKSITDIVTNSSVSKEIADNLGKLNVQLHLV